MFEQLQHRYRTATTRQRTWLAWAAAGAAIQACVPGLHGAWTAVGPLALWLWLLPLAALALELAVAPVAHADEGHGGSGRPQPAGSRPADAPSGRATSPPSGLSVTS
jgi:hypothetical protein